MKLIGNYKNDVKSLITGSAQYDPVDLNQFSETNLIKLSVFSDNINFQSEHILEKDVDYYYKNEEVYLRPNELLDREEYSEGSYTLQFDFIERYDQEQLYISDISPSRKEIRLRNVGSSPQVNIVSITNFLNEAETSQELNSSNNEDPLTNYKFNGFIELSSGVLIPINNYVVDKVTYGEDGVNIVLKLNAELPSNIEVLNRSFNVVKKWDESQTEDIYFVDKENLALGNERALPVDTAYLVNSTAVDDEVKNYNTLITSSGANLVSDLKQNKKDVNLNIDFSKFENHVFFGSAVSKLQNFKDKAVQLEGLYSELSSSLNRVSTQDIKEKRKEVFRKISVVKENFTAYERFMYNDNQKTTINSAPGLGTNLGGVNFNNDNGIDGGFNYKVYSGSLGEGFDKLYRKQISNKNTHLFTDIFNVEQPPFFNTNDFVYLSFILKHTGSIDTLHVSGGNSNISFNSDVSDNQYSGFKYRRSKSLPFNTFSGSALLNSPTTASHYKRYIFKSQQNYFRPSQTLIGGGGADVFDISDYGSTSTQIEVLSGSNVITASISGSVGDGFAYGVRDSSGQQTQYIFPSVVDQNNLSNTFNFITGSILPQGDLFPIFTKAGINESHFTDVRVSYKDPSNVHPFNNVYRPPSGSYAGSDEWNTWYANSLATASLHDDQNIHSLVNNIPLSLRSSEEHSVLRNFVNMLGEQFDLQRNYIDNYLNFYKLGYTNPNSMPDNLMPILGDSVGWELLNNQSNNDSIEDYAFNTAGDEVGVQAVMNSTWKKILNNLIYVYKVKGTTESINSLLNLYGFDSNGFKMREYGGSTAEHNPTIITNDSEDFLEGMKNIKGNVSFVQDIQPFPMMNFRGTNSLGVDWWRNDATANGIEFVFNSDKTTNNQTILRSSGSGNDLWDLRLIPSASSTDFSQLQFRLNTTTSGSGAIATNAISMSSPFVDFQNGNIYNVFLQREFVTGSTPNHLANFTQSYELFVARKDDDKIKNVSATSMSCHISGANFNFVEQASSKPSNNLFVGESLSGSLSELRTWSAYVSMSKFKQHTINYQSIVGNKITSSVDDLIYRYKFDENIVNWSTNPNSASLKLHDANSQRIKDYSITIADQNNFNYATTMTEQTFYKLAVKGTDKLPNDNQTNLAPKMTIAGELSPDMDVLGEPTDSSGKVERQFTNQFGRDVSYVNAIDSFVVNQLPDFRIDDFIGDPDEDLSDVYQDLMKLRKSLIGDTGVSIDVGKNLSSVESLISDEVKDTIEIMTPAKTNFEMFYDVKNDTLFRSKFNKKAQIQTQLNPGVVIGVIDADDFDEPSVIGFANNNVKTGIIDADSSDEPTVLGFANNNVKVGVIDADESDEPKLSAFVNNSLAEGIIDSDQWDEPTLSGLIENITGGTRINFVDLSKSSNEEVFNVTPKVGSHEMNEVFLGPKNHIGKNQGTGLNNRFFISSNKGLDGNYNTFKFENRFTFKTIGDTERFINSQSHHDNFRSFQNRHFVDKDHVSNYTYTSNFGVNGAGTVDGRMVGRTRFFFSDSNGNITYPSNHFINARTSKDRLLRLTYLGTQHNGSNPTTDPINRDPQPKESAYVLKVGGSDTVQRIKVERPVSATQRKITINSVGRVEGSFKFELFNKNKSILSVNLNTRGNTFNRTEVISFAQIGDVKNYNFKVTPITAGTAIRGAVVQRIVKRGRRPESKASISVRRNRIDNSLTGRITAIKDDFSLRVTVDQR